MQAKRTRYEVPGWGVGELWTRDGIVLAHDFDFGEEPPHGGRIGDDSTRGPLDRIRCLPPELVHRFRAYFAGEPVPFDDVELDLSAFTPFQRAIAGTLRRLPRGETVSYGELAALAGYPGAQRAAGSFCARNRFMLLVPCHRVVGADGIGSYGSAGVATKRRLLALEGVSL